MSTMQIQIRTDHNIEGHEALANQVRSIVVAALSRVRDRITHVDILTEPQIAAKIPQHFSK